MCWKNAQILALCTENDKRGNEERTYQMTFLPGKPNFGSSVGCGDTLLVHEMVEATAKAKGGTRQALRKGNVWGD